MKTTPKRSLFTIFLTITLFCASTIASAQTYLVNNFTPVASQGYTAYKTQSIKLGGGDSWTHGFALNSQNASATFNVGGKYETLMFALGFVDNFATQKASILTLYADGNKILDEVIRPQSIAKQITLNIKGVRELRFVFVQGEGNIGVMEATLWTAGSTPKATANVSTSSARTSVLFKDLKPYYQSNGHTAIPSTKYPQVKINSRSYDYGLLANSTMALIGNNEQLTHFNLRGQYAKLEFIFGPYDNKAHGKAWVTVLADDKIIYEYELSHDDIAKSVLLDITGCNKLTFQTEHSEGEIYPAIADAKVYPASAAPAQASAVGDAPVDPKLRSLPDVCKLISNIPPYAIGSNVDKQVYDGASDYITFSMGGQKFSEGFILYEKAWLMDDNVMSYAVFDLGNEFDYVSFTTGYVGKSWTMNNDKLRVYADDELVLETTLLATDPNISYVVPINRCRKLRFENQGSGKMDVAAFGVADLVVYRGKPVENTLFTHPVPYCPSEIDLIDLGKPYIHYVSTMSDHKDEMLYDGSTQRNYFDLNGKRITKGFLLQTSTHFSLDYGVLSETTGAGATAAIGAAAVGSSFVAGSVAVGGVAVGSTLAGVAAFLLLAAGGEAVENSCAAFNTYGEYNSLTFTVACLPDAAPKNGYEETLLIGADGEVVASMAVNDNMEPQTITVPINGCHQLMFWLANTGGTSKKYVFYDIRLSKEQKAMDIPSDFIVANAVISNPAWSEPEITLEWEKPASTSDSYINKYFNDLRNMWTSLPNLIKKCDPEYKIHTYYLRTEAGQICKAVQLISKSDHKVSITSTLTAAAREVNELYEKKQAISDLKFARSQANIALPNLGFAAVSYGKQIKKAKVVEEECAEVIETLYKHKYAEYLYLKGLVDSAVDIDGQKSDEQTIFAPLTTYDSVPQGDLKSVKSFSLN